MATAKRMDIEVADAEAVGRVPIGNYLDFSTATTKDGATYVLMPQDGTRKRGFRRIGGSAKGPSATFENLYHEIIEGSQNVSVVNGHPYGERLAVRVSKRNKDGEAPLIHAAMVTEKTWFDKKEQKQVDWVPTKGYVSVPIASLGQFTSAVQKLQAFAAKRAN